VKSNHNLPEAYVKALLNQNRKVKITLSLSAKVIERMRNVVYWTPALTLSGLAESGIESKLKKFEKGRRVRVRKGMIRVGRPCKTVGSRLVL
jgi:hypothetical protein